ncbi:MAG: hypothetical protein RL094_791 [Candidatus Parcubacteria bacterium]|jgi:hypothetical protein
MYMKKHILIVLALVFAFPFTAHAQNLPSVASFTQTPSAEFGGSIKIQWTTSNADYVLFTLVGPDFGSISGVQITDARTGEDFPLVTQELKTNQTIYVKMKNMTTLPKEVWAVLDPSLTNPPLTSDSAWVMQARKVIKIAVAPSKSSPTIQTLSPSSATVGTTVVIKGSNFSQKDNWVSFETTKGSIYGIQQWNLPSSNGSTLQFVIPADLTTMSEGPTQGNILVTPGTYQVAVSNDYGKSVPKMIEIVNKPTPKAQVSVQTSPSINAPAPSPKIVTTPTTKKTPNITASSVPAKPSPSINNTENQQPEKETFMRKIFKSIYHWFN